VNILMLAPQPFFTPRGTPFSVLYRLRALAALGHSVDLVTYHVGSDPAIPGVAIHRIPALPGVRSVRIGPSPVKIALDVLLFAKALRLVEGRRYDLIHTHEEAGFMGAFLGRLTGIPHLYDMHSSLPQQFANFEAYNWPPVVGVFTLLEKAILAGADGVITICPDLRDHVERASYPGPHALIENCFTEEIDPRAALEAAAGLEARHALRGRRVILYTGTLEAYQGLPQLVEAAAILKEEGPGGGERERSGPSAVSATARGGHRALTAPAEPDGGGAAAGPEAVFVIVGGAPRQVDELRAQVAERGLSGRFILPGQVEPREIPSWIGMATLLVSPRVSGTNTPLKIYQYMKSGVPLVATRIHSHTQVLDDEICLLVEPSARGIAAGIAKLLASPARAAALADAARRRAQAEWSNDAYVRKVARIVEEVAGEGPSAARAA
jgi:glycosyltransferase involved in cell wall biosynthesis